MEMLLDAEDHRKIAAGIREKYVRVAVSPDGHFSYPTGRKGLQRLNYDAGRVAELPDRVADSYCGVGNPFSLGAVNPGDHVLDVGCGAGVDTILAGMMTGPDGRAVGIDGVPEMLERAAKNAGQVHLKHVAFQKADAAALPFDDAEFDVVISNGVFNLVPDKQAALKEVFRVLKPGGRLMIADQITAGPVAKDLKARVDSWFR